MCPAESGEGPDPQGARNASVAPDEGRHCVRCNAPAPELPLGGTWPCPNCGFLKAVTEAIVRTASAKPENVHIVLHDAPAHNLAREGILLADRK